MRHSAPDTVNGQSDEELMQLYVSTKDADAFTLLYDRYRDPLVRYICSRGHTAYDAEDIVQETLFSVSSKAEQWDGRSVRPWISTIAANKAIDYRRRNRRDENTMSLDQELVHASGDAFHSAETLEDEKMLTSAEQCSILEIQELVRKMLSHLSVSRQKLVKNLYFDYLKYREIAEELGVPTGTVKSRMHNIIMRLRKIAEENGITEDLLDAA